LGMECAYQLVSGSFKSTVTMFYFVHLSLILIHEINVRHVQTKRTRGALAALHHVHTTSWNSYLSRMLRMYTWQAVSVPNNYTHVTVRSHVPLSIAVGSIQRAELGYLLNGTVFDSRGRLTNASGSSIRGLAERFPNVDFDDLIRGNSSFGAFVEMYGYPAVPSPANRGPGKGNLYFRGGYLTRRHGSEDGGFFDAIQIESAVSHRESQNIESYALALARAIRSYVCHYYQPESTDVAVGCQPLSVTSVQSRATPLIAMYIMQLAAICFVVLLRSSRGVHSIVTMNRDDSLKK